MDLLAGSAERISVVSGKRAALSTVIIRPRTECRHLGQISSKPDAELDVFVEALATRIAKFDKWAIAQTKRLANTSLPPDVELGAGWDACIASLGRPAAQHGIKALMERGFHKPGDVENRLG